MAPDQQALIAIALFVAAALRGATPLCIAAIGGAFSAQVNVFNVALEGMMLLGAFCGFAVSDLTGNVLLGLLAGGAGAMLLAFVVAFLVIDLRANEVVVGIAANLAVLGLTSTLLKTIYGASGAQQSTTAGLVASWRDNPFSAIPVLGQFLSSLDGMMLFAVLVTIAAQVVLFRTWHGLRMRAIGNDRETATSAGIGIRRYTYAAFLGGGLLCGIAGAYYPLSGLSMFSSNMTAGAGFIALAAVLFGNGRPFRVAAAALIFGAATAASYRLQTQWLPSEVVLVIPYLATVAALVFNAIRARARHRPPPSTVETA